MVGIAVVTGASSGVGRISAQALAKAGWKVGLIARRADSLQAAATDIREQGGEALVLQADICKADQVEEAFATVARQWGRLDLLFNNAGISLPGRTIDEIEPEDWQRVVDTNLTGSFLCARAAFRQMRHQTPQGGRIINNGSISAYAPRPGSVAYTSTKHAITGLTRTLALDGRPFDIACGQIDIGNALTEMAKPMTMGVRQANGEMMVEAVMDPTHVANAVVHMASLPLEANVLFMNVMATKMPFVGRG